MGSITGIGMLFRKKQLTDCKENGVKEIVVKQKTDRGLRC